MIVLGADLLTIEDVLRMARGGEAVRVGWLKVSCLLLLDRCGDF